MLAGAVLVGLGLIAAFAGSSSAGPPIGIEFKHGPRVEPAVFADTVRALTAPTHMVRRTRLEHELEPASGPKQALPGVEEPAPAPTAVTAPAPDPTITFKGLDYNTWGDGHPPDTVGDVGPNHFIQAVNTSIGIFRKSDGVRLAAFTFNSLWAGAGTGTSCDVNNYGDPTVIYDPLGDRWIVADFAFVGSGTAPPYYECIAVSRTSDPVAGGWYLYAIRTDDVSHPWFADYPKMGIWPDGLYMTANMFGSTYNEVRVWAFNRADLESGVAVRNVVVDLSTPSYFSLLPSNMRSAVGAPPAGRPNLMIAESESLFAFEVWKFHVDYSGSGSTLTGPTNVSQATYTTAPSTVPSPGNSLDSLEERLMMQAQYTNIAGAESVWVNHTVGSPAGIQWAQLDVTGGIVATTPVQQQIYPPANDGLYRWMGSLAVDKAGDMALGYSVSNRTTNPDIRYAGRLAGDPLNTLPQTEKSMLPGVTRATQSGNCGGGKCIRWGDYSAMTIDPDGCRFWYTQEYYETKGLDWQTRIGSFSFPSCGNGKTDQTIAFGGPTAKTFGDPDFAVSATASSGLPVSFSAAGNCNVSGSTVHITGAGSCTVTASQAGNSTYNAAPDVARTFAIARANQTITFGALANKTYGDSDFAVSASASSGLPIKFAPSGNCTLTIATVHITGAGSCTVTATQSGDTNFNAAPDVPQTFSIAKASQTITFGALAAKTYGDPDFTVAATASSGLAVAFAVGGNCSIVGSTVHITGAGSCTVTASQAGDANYNAAPDVPRGFSIAKANQTITFGALADKELGAADFDPGATASSGLSVTYGTSGACTIVSNKVHLTGPGTCEVTASQGGDTNYSAAVDVPRNFAIKSGQTITFDPLPGKTYGDADFLVSAAASSGLTVSFAAAGSCTVTEATVHLTGAGSCTVTASQAGDPNYLAAPNVVHDFGIAKASQSIVFGALPGRTYGDADFGVSGTASSGLPVAFGGGGNCSVGGSNVHITSAGSCTVTASQPGNANYNAATPVAQTFAISKASQTISFGALAGKTFGDPNFAVAATASSGLPVTFLALGTCTLAGSTVGITGAGSCTVTAAQFGDPNYTAAAPVSQTFAIAKASQAITFGALASKTYGAADFTVAATASSGLAVSFTASGSCSVGGAIVHLTGAGSCNVTASQPGDTNYNAAPDVAQSFAIARPPLTPATICRVPRVVGKSLAGAKLALKQRHCRAGKVSYAYSRKSKRGVVTSQSRQSGRVLPANAKINLVVSRGRRP